MIRKTCDGAVDLLVTGSRGYAPRRALIGSVSEASMEGAAHPVLVLPRSPHAADVTAPAARIAPPVPRPWAPSLQEPAR